MLLPILIRKKNETLQLSICLRKLSQKDVVLWKRKQTAKSSIERDCLTQLRHLQVVLSRLTDVYISWSFNGAAQSL